jgi:PAS domain S-box-containing protein
MGQIIELRKFLEFSFKKHSFIPLIIEYFLFFILSLLFFFYFESNSLKIMDDFLKKTDYNEKLQLSSDIKVIGFDKIIDEKYKNLIKKNEKRAKSDKINIILRNNFSIELIYTDYLNKTIIIKTEKQNKLLLFIFVPLLLTILFWIFLNMFFKKPILNEMERRINTGINEILNQIEKLANGTKLKTIDNEITINESFVILKGVEKLFTPMNENLNYNRKSKSFWKSVLDNIDYPIFLINKNAIITYGNKPAKEFFGEKINDKSSIYGVESLQNLRENIYNSIDTMKKFVLHKVRVRTDDDKVRVFDFTFIPFRDNNQLSFALIGKEVSEYLNFKTNLESLTEIEDRGILIIKDSGKIIHFNAHICTILKCSKEKVKDMDFFNILEEDDRKKIISEINKRKSGEINVSLRNSEGNYIPIKIRFGSAGEKGNKTIYLIVEDIGKKLVLQRELSFYKIMGNIFAKLTVLLRDRSASSEIVLREVGQYLNFDKILIIDLETDKNSLSLSYELNINPRKIPEEGKKTKINYNMKIDKIPPLKYSFNNVYFFDIKSSPMEIVKYLKFKNIQSMISIPINMSNKKIRFMIFESFSKIIRFTEEEKKMIVAVINTIAGHYEIQLLKQIVKFSLNRYLSIFDKIDFPVYLIDIDTYEIVFTNKAMKKLLGGKSLEKGRCFEIIYKNKKICPFCLLKDKNNEKQIVEFDDNFYLISQKNIELSKSKSFLFTSMINITEKRIYEKKIQISQKLELLGQFAGGFIHDINNIIAGISGNIQMLELTKEDDKRKKYIDRTKSIINKATEMAQHVLNFSREKEEKREIISLSSVLEDALGIATPSISKNISIEKRMDCVLNVAGKGNQLLQVFLNLLTNARDALDNKKENGVIRVSLNKKTIGPNEAQKYGVKSGVYAVVEIKDNGTGMDKKIMAKIFEPFFTTKEKDNKKGTGIGLSTVLRIIKEHEGFIDVKSRRGEGTSFFIYLPLHKKTVKKGEEKERRMIPEEIRKSFKGVLLLIEDDEVIREATQDILEYMGYEVLSVSDVEEGKEILKKNKIDVLVLDIQLKENSSEKILKYINRRKEKIDKVIVYHLLLMKS